MESKKFLDEVVSRLEAGQVHEKVIKYVVFKIKQSFRNGVEVGVKKQAAKAKGQED